jgi:hypothetical protein
MSAVKFEKILTIDPDLNLIIADQTCIYSTIQLYCHLGSLLSNPLN